jgi:branched-chain amino acid transport system ATP-binding protein
MSLLFIEALTAHYGAGLALDQISLTVEPGEVVALLGANGAGKSTLLKAVIGLLPATGTIQLGGEAIEILPPEQRARRGLGYVPEGRRVFPGMSVRDNLLVACFAGAASADRRLAEVLTLFPALAERAAASAWQLSGGQQQMLAIGRALMGGPKLLLLDEPSLGLAPIIADEVMAHIRMLAARGTAVLLAEQSVARALGIAQRAYALSRGRIVAQGTPDALEASGALEQAFLGAEIAVSSP